MEEALRRIMTLFPSIADTLPHVLAIVGPYGMKLHLCDSLCPILFSSKDPERDHSYPE